MDQTLKRIVFSKGAQKLKDTLYKRKSSMTVRNEQHSVTFDSGNGGGGSQAPPPPPPPPAAISMPASKHVDGESVWEVEVVDGTPVSFSSSGARTHLSSPASTSSDGCDACECCGSELGIHAEIIALKASLERLQAKVASKAGNRHDDLTTDSQEESKTKANSSPRLKPRKLDLGGASARASALPIGPPPPAAKPAKPANPKPTPQTKSKPKAGGLRTPSFPAYEESPFQKGVQHRYAALSKNRGWTPARVGTDGSSGGGVGDDDDDDDPVSFWDFATDDIGLRSGSLLCVPYWWW